MRVYGHRFLDDPDPRICLTNIASNGRCLHVRFAQPNHPLMRLVPMNLHRARIFHATIVELIAGEIVTGRGLVKRFVDVIVCKASRQFECPLVPPSDHGSIHQEMRRATKGELASEQLIKHQIIEGASDWTTMRATELFSNEAHVRRRQQPRE